MHFLFIRISLNTISVRKCYIKLVIRYTVSAVFSTDILLLMFEYEGKYEYFKHNNFISSSVYKSSKKISKLFFFFFFPHNFKDFRV